MVPERRAYDADVAEIKSELRSLVLLINERNEYLKRMLEEHHKTLYGEGSDPGLSKTVDRLNQAKGHSDKHLFAIYSAGVVLILNAIREYFTKP